MYMDAINNYKNELKSGDLEYTLDDDPDYLEYVSRMSQRDQDELGADEKSRQAFINAAQSILKDLTYTDLRAYIKDSKFLNEKDKTDLINGFMENGVIGNYYLERQTLLNIIAHTHEVSYFKQIMGFMDAFQTLDQKYVKKVEGHLSNIQNIALHHQKMIEGWNSNIKVVDANIKIVSNKIDALEKKEFNAGVNKAVDRINEDLNEKVSAINVFFQESIKKLGGDTSKIIDGHQDKFMNIAEGRFVKFSIIVGSVNLLIGIVLGKLL